MQDKAFRDSKVHAVLAICRCWNAARLAVQRFASTHTLQDYPGTKLTVPGLATSSKRRCSRVRLQLESMVLYLVHGPRAPVGPKVSAGYHRTVHRHVVYDEPSTEVPAAHGRLEVAAQPSRRKRHAAIAVYLLYEACAALKDGRSTVAGQRSHLSQPYSSCGWQGAHYMPSE